MGERYSVHTAHGADGYWAGYQVWDNWEQRGVGKVHSERYWTERAADSLNRQPAGLASRRRRRRGR